MGQVTMLLAEVGAGRREALDALYGLLYGELRKLAHSRIRRSGELTLLDTVGLVHESYLRLERAGELRFDDRGHFMAYAARVMRSVVVDAIRQRGADRHGGGVEHVELDADVAAAVADPSAREVLRVHESLQELEVIDARLVRIVEMRYFAGMTVAEVADSLGVAERTVARDWEKARLFLQASLG
jgi:RNA polymerase sigma factor (TIGR02999 family)